ncbi:hypothetical protein LSAT2_027556 [Lamellibrachia satsuma]|nr:hypothetical protein LSAT2_027556 [Lamellibrachia satsuma]
MLLVFLTVSVMLLGTIQAQHIGELCFRTCELLPWLAWGPCDSTCGGTRWRERKVCCEQDWSPTTCGIKCHLTLSDVIETAACRLNCVFGVSLGSQCRCEDHGYGRCCQFSNLTCSDNPCKNNATCVNRDRRYECQCTSGWFGPNCGVGRLPCGINVCVPS